MIQVLSTDGPPKYMLIEKVKNREIFRSVQDFDLFSRTEAHKIELKRFIEINIEFISKLKNFDEINHIEGVDLKFYPPNIVNTPVLDGVLDCYVIKENTNLDKREYILYHSQISRLFEDRYWNLSSIYGRTSLAQDKNGFALFKEKDFDDLNLKFKEKNFLKDIPRNELLKYTSSKYKEITPKEYDEIEKRAYAIYEFETIRNRFTIKLSFTVTKDKYIENSTMEDLLYEWFQLLIEQIDDQIVNQR